jgi:hypothetical protein
LESWSASPNRGLGADSAAGESRVTVVCSDCSTAWLLLNSSLSARTRKSTGPRLTLCPFGTHILVLPGRSERAGGEGAGVLPAGRLRRPPGRGQAAGFGGAHSPGATSCLGRRPHPHGATARAAPAGVTDGPSRAAAPRLERRAGGGRSKPWACLPQNHRY